MLNRLLCATACGDKETDEPVDTNKADTDTDTNIVDALKGWKKGLTMAYPFSEIKP